MCPPASLVMFNVRLDVFVSLVRRPPLACVMTCNRRRLEETAEEILKVSERPELMAYNKLLRWQLALRNPYLDPVNIMQVASVGVASKPRLTWFMFFSCLQF